MVTPFPASFVTNVFDQAVGPRAVPIIGLAKISATDMAIFTNIGIGTKQYEDRYRYRYLYSNSLYINGL